MKAGSCIKSLARCNEAELSQSPRFLSVNWYMGMLCDIRPSHWNVVLWWTLLFSRGQLKSWCCKNVRSIDWLSWHFCLIWTTNPAGSGSTWNLHFCRKSACTIRESSECMTLGFWMYRIKVTSRFSEFNCCYSYSYYFHYCKCKGTLVLVFFGSIEDCTVRMQIAYDSGAQGSNLGNQLRR